MTKQAPLLLNVRDKKRYRAFVLRFGRNAQPNAQEAFFHLGKLAKTSDTLNSIIRYAKDIRMEPALLAEPL